MHIMRKAIQDFDAPLVTRILRDHPECVHARDPFSGHTWLHIFYEEVGHKRMMDEDAWSPAVYATLQALLDAGVDVADCGEMGYPVYNLLACASTVICRKQHCELLYMLINFGAKPIRTGGGVPWLEKYIASRNDALDAKRAAIPALLWCLRQKLPKGVDLLVAHHAVLWHRYAWRGWVAK